MKANAQRTQGAACLAIVAALLAAAAIAFAQESASPRPTAAGNSGGSHVAERLAGAQAELKRLEGPEGLSAGAPESATPEELEDRRSMLQALVFWCQWQLERAQMLADLKQHGTDAGVLGSIETLPKSPPYSYLMVDRLRREQHVLEVALKAAEAGGAIAAQEKERAQEEVRLWEGKNRQLAERQESTREPAQLARLKWERELARLHEQVAGARLGTVDLARQFSEEETRLIRQKLAAVAPAVARMAPAASFSKQEFELVRSNLDAARRANQAQLGPALSASAAAMSALGRVRRTVQQAQGTAATGPPSTDLGQLDRMVRIRSARADNAALRVNAILLAGQMLKLREDIWRRRWLLANSPGPAALKKAAAAIDQMRGTATAVRAHAELQLELANEQLNALRSGAIEATQRTKAREIQELASLYDDRAAIGRQTLQTIQTANDLLNRWALEVEQRRQQETGVHRLRDWADAINDTARRVWNFELVAVEDTIEVEGQIFTGKRSVTVNKVVSAILIFVIGSWLGGWLLKRIERIAVRHFGKDQNQVQLVRKWVQSLVVLVFGVIALIWVKIPLTVFAFLGGAVAIGAGFGMQTLLKNLISGLMLLVERPFKLGDLVEVGGMRGRIMDIGVRSSVVRSVEGIETLIPNSIFLEQNVTNWTYSSRKVRFSIPVGVAYGSDVRKVREVLLEVAARQPLILADPPPSVLFNDFGNDALIFNLNFWLEMRADVDSYAVRSDMRFMIERALGDAGVVIAFPQRDVHLDTARPLQVEVVTAPSSRPKKPD